MDEDLTYLPEYLQPIVHAFLDLVARYMTMLRDKKITVDKWKTLMQEAIAEHHAAAFMAGLQSTEITLPMQRMIEDAVAFQLPFLDNFARVIAALPLATITLPDGRVIENAIPITPELQNRARLYTFATATTAEEGNVIRQVGRALPLPAMPGQGTQCLTRCGCTWVIKTLNAKNGDYNAFWTLDPRKVHCQTCTQRDIEWNGDGKKPVRIRGGVLLLEDEIDPLET